MFGLNFLLAATLACWSGLICWLGLRLLGRSTPTVDAGLEVTQPRVANASDPSVFGSQEVIRSSAVRVLSNITRFEVGTVANALLSDVGEMPSGHVMHWRFEFSDGQIPGKFGITTRKKFGRGYYLRNIGQNGSGYFYANGRKIAGGWASYGNPGIVDWYMERPSEKVVKIYSVVNGNVQAKSAQVNFENPDTVDKLLPYVTFDDYAIGKPANSKCTLRVYKPTIIDPTPGVGYRNQISAKQKPEISVQISAKQEFLE